MIVEIAVNAAFININGNITVSFKFLITSSWKAYCGFTCHARNLVEDLKSTSYKSSSTRYNLETLNGGF